MRTTISISFLLAAAVQPRPAYHVTDLGNLGAPGAEGISINSRGSVVGSSATPDGSWHAFLWENGSMYDLGTLGGINSWAYGLNDSDQVVGVSDTTALNSYGQQVQQAFLYLSGTMINLNSINERESVAYTLNSAGQVVGTLSPTPSSATGFIWANGNLSYIGGRNVLLSYGVGINSLGQATGSALLDSFVDQAYIYSNGVLQMLGTLGGGSSSGYSINDLGQVAGSSEYNSDQSVVHAFLYSGGNMQDLATLGGATSVAECINNLGQIVGFSTLATSENDDEGFISFNGTMVGLNSVLDSSGDGFDVQIAEGINDSGLIACFATSQQDDVAHALLLTPVSQNTIVPDSYSLIIGSQTSGSLYSIQFNDSWYLTVEPGVTTLLSEAPIQVQLSGTSPTMSPANFQFTFTGHVNSINLSQSILLYNFNTNASETLNTSAAHSGSDSTITVPPTGDLTRFVNRSTGEVRARVNFSRAGRTSLLLWTASLGVANWIIS